MTDTRHPLAIEIEAMQEEERRAKAASAEMLASLQAAAMADRKGSVTVPAETLLQVLSHVQELRSDLAAVQNFIRDEELEDGGNSPARWAWNNLLYEFAAETRLGLYDLEVIPDPLIDRLDRAEQMLDDARRLLKTRIDGYVKATQLLEILTPPAADEQNR